MRLRKSGYAFNSQPHCYAARSKRGNTMRLVAPLTPTTLIFNKLKALLVECGADSNYIRYEYTKAKIRVIYTSWQHEISYKTFKKKPNQILLNEKLSKKDNGILSEKKNSYWIYEFTEVSELDALSPYIERFVIETHKDDFLEWHKEHWND